jgi:hypothetical protein
MSHHSTYDPLNQRSTEQTVHLIHSLFNNYYVPPLNEWSTLWAIHSTNKLLYERFTQQLLHPTIPLPIYSMKDPINNYYVPPLNEWSDQHLPRPTTQRTIQSTTTMSHDWTKDPLNKRSTQRKIYSTITTSHHSMNNPINNYYVPPLIFIVISSVKEGTNERRK